MARTDTAGTRYRACPWEVKPEALFLLWPIDVCRATSDEDTAGARHRTCPFGTGLVERGESAAQERSRDLHLPLCPRQRGRFFELLDAFDPPRDRRDARQRDPRRPVGMPRCGDAHLRERPALAIHRL